MKPKKTQSNTDPGKKPSDNVSKDDSQTTEDKKPSDGGNNTSGTTDGQQTKKKQTIKAKNNHKDIQVQKHFPSEQRQMVEVN